MHRLLTSCSSCKPCIFGGIDNTTQECLQAVYSRFSCTWCFVASQSAHFWTPIGKALLLVLLSLELGELHASNPSDWGRLQSLTCSNLQLITAVHFCRCYRKLLEGFAGGQLAASSKGVLLQRAARALKNARDKLDLRDKPDDTLEPPCQSRLPVFAQLPFFDLKVSCRCP